MRRILLLISFLVVSLPSGQIARAQSASGASGAGLKTARAHAQRALDDFDAGRFAEAAEGFQKADGAYPAPQYRLFRARALAKLGKVASAAHAYEQALMMPVPASVPPGFREAQAAAQAELAELRPRVPVIRVAVRGPAAGWRVTLDGVPLRADELGNVQVDPGRHTLVVKASGFEPQSRDVEVREGGSETIEVALRLPVPSDMPPTTGMQSPEAARDERSPPLYLSHRHQLGLVVRADVDPLSKDKGVLFAPGLTFGVIDWLEVGLNALVGKNSQGLEPDLTGYVLTGMLRPLVNIGMPIGLNGGVRVGLRGAAGLQWDPLRNFGMFAQVGGAYFFNANAPMMKAYFVPSLGVQGRI